jgi:hypothetical protein
MVVGDHKTAKPVGRQQFTVVSRLTMLNEVGEKSYFIDVESER